MVEECFFGAYVEIDGIILQITVLLVNCSPNRSALISSVGLTVFSEVHKNELVGGEVIFDVVDAPFSKRFGTILGFWLFVGWSYTENLV